MTDKEAVKHMEYVLYQAGRTNLGPESKQAGNEALAVLTAMAERHEKTERQLAHMSNELGNTKERCRKLQAENAALKAEAERLNKRVDAAEKQTLDYEKEKAKAQEDVLWAKTEAAKWESSAKTWHDANYRLQAKVKEQKARAEKAEAELAELREKFDRLYDLCPHSIRDKFCTGAALAYREGKEKP